MIIQNSFFSIRATYNTELKDCRIRLRLAKSSVVGWIWRRRGAARGFQNFQTLLQMLRNVNWNAALQRKWMEIDTFMPIAAGKCSSRMLDSCWVPLKWCRKAIGKCPRLLESLWTILKGHRKAAGKGTNTRCQPIGEEVELPSSYWQERGKFPSLFNEVLSFCLHTVYYRDCCMKLRLAKSYVAG